jgi:hypothetical protein
LLTAFLLGLAEGSSRAAPPIAAEKFGHIRAVIKPRPGEEKWNDIHWLSSLWEARQKAAALGKPILLWEMDGNPLACT